MILPMTMTMKVNGLKLEHFHVEYLFFHTLNGYSIVQYYLLKSHIYQSHDSTRVYLNNDELHDEDWHRLLQSHGPREYDNEVGSS